jgi:hypothetical protein
MAIDIDDARFHQILFLTLAKDTSLETYETRALIQIAQLAAWVDYAEPVSAEERVLLGQLVTHLYVHGGIEFDSVEALSPVPTDHEERMARIQVIADDLDRAGVRELGYVIAWLLIVADLQLAAVEEELLEDLQDAFGIEASRATELAGAVTRIVTPPERTNTTTTTEARRT